MRVRRWIIALAAAFAALNVLAFMHVRAMTHFVPGGTRTPFPERLSLAGKLRVVLTGVTVPRPANAQTPAAAGLAFEDWSFHSADGVKLAAWHIPAPGSKTTIVMHHGYAGSRAFLVEEAAILHGMGHSLVLVDFRGSGESAGDTTTIGVDEARDVQASFDETRRKLPGQRVVILGQSMGAAAALRAVHLGLVEPDGLIVEAPFDTMLRTVGNRFTAMGAPAWPFANLLVYWGGWLIGTDAFAHNPVDYARSVTCPAVVISGAQDRRVRPDEARAVFDALGGWKRLKIFEDAGHLMYVKRDAAGWKEVVADLLR